MRHTAWLLGLLLAGCHWLLPFAGRQGDARSDEPVVHDHSLVAERSTIPDRALKGLERRPVDAPAREATKFDHAEIDSTTKSDGTAKVEGGITPDAAITTCGSYICATATQICVVNQGSVVTTFQCAPVPAICGNDRTCACLANIICVSKYDVCKDTTVPNTVSCICTLCV